MLPLEKCNIPNFQFGMLYTRSSLHIIFIAFWLILEIFRNSRTLGESWGFRYFHIHERNEIDKIFFEQRPLPKHNLPIETLGGPPPPKGDPVFE